MPVKARPRRRGKPKSNLKIGDPVFKFYEGLHFFEMETREKLNSKFQIFLTGALAIIGFLSAVLKNSYPADICSLPVYVLLGGASYLSLAVSGWFFIRSYVGLKYKYYATPEKLDQYRKDLINRDLSHAVNEADDLFYTTVLDELITTSTHNAMMNETRFNRIYLANYFFVGAIILAFFSSVAFWFVQRPKDYANLLMDNSYKNLDIKDVKKEITATPATPAASDDKGTQGNSDGSKTAYRKPRTAKKTQEKVKQDVPR